MITRGTILSDELIEVISDDGHVSYKVKVAIPMLDGQLDKDYKENDWTFTALVSTDNHQLCSYKAGDRVWVTFIGNDASNPLVIGHVYEKNTVNKGCGLTLDSLVVNQSASLPQQTNIGGSSLAATASIENFKIILDNMSVYYTDIDSNIDPNEILHKEGYVWRKATSSDIASSNKWYRVKQQNTYEFTNAPLGPGVWNITATFNSKSYLAAIGNNHTGLDIACEIGTPVYAIHSGIYKHGTANSGNKYVLIKGDNGYGSSYYHLNSFISYRHDGDHVNSGDLIGYSGNSGVSTGPHLHIAIWKIKPEYNNWHYPINTNDVNLFQDPEVILKANPINMNFTYYGTYL